MGTQLGLWSRDDRRPDTKTPVVFSVRESGRARHLRLQARPPRTVELVVPTGLRPELVDRFLEQHRDWIDRAGREMLQRYPEPDLRPATIELEAIGQQLAVSYEFVGRPAGQRAGYIRSADRLRLVCRNADGADSPALLRRWLLAEGRRVLVPWLEREASALGLAPRRIQVRLQKTRWGSCSARGAISLNAALLLVRPALVRYLFVHELAHLRHLSHSAAYWRTVARFEPNFEALDRELARRWMRLPAWLLALTHGDPA